MKNRQRKFSLILIDLLILLVCYGVCMLFTLTNSIKLNGELSVGVFFIGAALFCVCVFGFRLAFQVYNNIWRYASMGLYLRLVVADFCAGVVALGAGQLFAPLNLGLGVTLCTLLSCALATVSIRFFYQLIYAHRDARRGGGDDSHKINIAIVGAGNVGATLANELLRNPGAHYHPVCFFDVDKSKAGQRLNGIPIYAEDDNIVEQIKALPLQEIVIALPDAGSDERERLYNLYRTTGCKVKLYDYPLDSKSEVKSRRSVRELRIEDLLFRDSIKFDNSMSYNYYEGKTVLVTGGGGSIGSELCRQIAKMHPKKLVIFDIYENNAYDIQQELIRKYGGELNLHVLIGSVRDVKRLNEVFDAHRPDVVLHAAAHKHVPLMERSAVEAIKNNVIGTYNTANMAEKYGVQKFVLISTDKAVNPTNIMGASKRLCEMVIQCRSDSKTKFVAVRFGNVLGSNGSVIPLFEREIEAGGPITITDKRIIRYFMTIPEAAQLVLQAGALAQKGELFVLDMGKPVKIYDLAENMIRLSGLVPNKDIDIVEIGLRPGEKLYEELLMRSEDLDRTENERIFIERDKPFTRDEIEEKLTVLRNALSVSTNEAVKSAVKEVVPTFRDPEEINKTATDSDEMKTANAADPATV